jgi:hypothetical protein
MSSSRTGRYILLAAMLTIGLPAHAQGVLQQIEKAAPSPPPGTPDPRKSPQQNVDQMKKDLGGAGKAAGNAAKQGAELPVDVAKEGIKLSEEAAGTLIKQVTDIVSKGIDELKAKVDTFIKDEKAALLAEAMPYLYLAAGAFLAILLVPAILSSILTVWIVRRMDRRSARRERIQHA